MTATDDLGHPVALPPAVRRVVCLVPSLTEALAATAPDLVVGATDWCIHPPGLDAVRVGGTKNPDVEAITALRPDLVVANEEENRAVDLESLRRNGIAVWVTQVRTVPEGLASLGRLLAVCGLGRPQWLVQAQDAWREPPRLAEPVQAVVPIWRRPWMALGRETFAGDLLARIGVHNVLADAGERYPRFDVGSLPPHDLVVLPDEPYAFSAADGPEAFGAPSALVGGRHLTWYGPSLVEAAALLVEQLTAVRPVR